MVLLESYKNYDSLSFASDLAGNSGRLLSIFSDGDVNTKLRIFNDVLHSTLDSYALVRTFKIRGRPCPYITHEIKERMRTSACSDWQNYRGARNTVKITLKNAARNHTFDEVQKHRDNSGFLWKIINRNISLKEKESQVYYKDPKLVANEFNQFFNSLGKKTPLKQHCALLKTTISNCLTAYVCQPPIQQMNCLIYDLLLVQTSNELFQLCPLTSLLDLIK